MARKVVPMGSKVKKDSRREPWLRSAPASHGRCTVLLCGALLLAGCARTVERGGAPATVPSSAGGPVAGAGGPPVPGVRRYHVDAARSWLTIRVFRGGALAAAGHNHVIAAHDLQGEVDRAPRLEASRVSLRIPVAQLTVDEPALRAQAGAEFAAEVPDPAREGTKRNLLGAALLDAGRFPLLRLDSTQVAAAPGGVRLTLRAQVRNATSTFDVPVTLEVQGTELVASGAVELRQSQLGLTPFSVMMGALQVQDAMQVQFRLVAVP
jgi:polyisoprenoid-binding protein YceI